MPNTNEKLAFSKRLKLALKRSDKKISTPVELALQFNLRHRNEPISAQAAQKWLTGKAKPTADKIDTLAKWLVVSPHWLRYGSANGEQIVPVVRQTKTQSNSALSESEVGLISQFRQLSEHQKSLIADLVEQLAAEWKS
jgi:transcriptional regulator with XRE-family HTH domain